MEREEIIRAHRAASLYGRGYLYRMPNGQQLALDPKEITVVLNDDDLTTDERIRADERERLTHPTEPTDTGDTVDRTQPEVRDGE